MGRDLAAWKRSTVLAKDIAGKMDEFKWSPCSKKGEKALWGRDCTVSFLKTLRLAQLRGLLYQFH